MARLSFTSLDGRRLTIDTDVTWGELPFSSVATVQWGDKLLEVTSGALGFSEAVAADEGLTFNEQLRLDGGLLRAGVVTRVEPDTKIVDVVRLIAWDGRAHSIVCTSYAQTVDELVAFFEDLEIDEADDGVSVHPRTGTIRDDQFPVVSVRALPTVGLFEFSHDVARRQQLLPAWRGTQTRAGELFRDVAGPDNEPYYVLAGKSTFATIMPSPDFREEALVRAADRSSFAWSR